MTHPLLTDKQVRFYEKEGIDVTPRFRGKTADAGRIDVGRFYPNEGWALIKCGGTEIRVSYSLLHNLQLAIDGDHADFAHVADLENALDHIRCEAMIGNTGE